MSGKLQTASSTTAERVYTVSDFHDFPLAGIADFQGRPHMYARQFSRVEDDWTDLFWLMEIDEKLRELANEQAGIFGRWAAEFWRGNVSLHSHPALPADRSRFEALTASIGGRLKLEPTPREGSVIARRPLGEVVPGLFPSAPVLSLL